MRKLIIVIGLVACFFSFYGLGAYLKTYPLAPRGTLTLPPLTKQQLPITVPSARKFPPQQASAPGHAPKAHAKSIEEDKGAELVENLQGRRLDPFSRLQESVERRFSAEYPRNEVEATKEAANRLAVLQAMSQYSRQVTSRTELQTLTQFYEKVGSNEAENPAVRRESWRNLLQTIGQRDEDERLKIYARAGRFLSSATRPANEMLEEIFREGKR